MAYGESIWIGYDPREAEAFSVCRGSIKKRLNSPFPIRGLVLDDLRAQGLYTRQTDRRDGQLWDAISGAPMATEFAIGRFLVPHLAGREGWAVFMDCDILARANLGRIFEGLDPSKAVYCVQHKYDPPAGKKMDNQEQTRYARKNWSSVMVFNLGHIANRELTPKMINMLPGRDLHRFCWLDDDEIGALDPSWNYLVGHTEGVADPKLVHFTEGGPWMPGYENVEYAGEWLAERNKWAA